MPDNSHLFNPGGFAFSEDALRAIQEQKERSESDEPRMGGFAHYRQAEEHLQRGGYEIPAITHAILALVAATANPRGFAAEMREASGEAAPTTSRRSRKDAADDYL